MNLGEPEDRSVAAGEYVLGTQDAEARAAFEQALAADAALQAEIYVWQDRLLGLAGRVAPAEPPLQMWPQIEAKIAAPVIAPRATGSARPANASSRSCQA